LKRSLTVKESGGILCAPSAMPYCGLSTPAVSGAIWKAATRHGKACTTISVNGKRLSLWEQILDALVVEERKRQQRQETPGLLAVDSQSVKTINFVSLDTGIDGAKKLNGRKRHLAVDTLGLPWATLVTSAGVSDSAAGCQLVDLLKGKVPRLEKIAADHGYKASFTDHVNKGYQWQVEIAQRPESTKGFVPQKNRWPVERSFGWLNFRRRLARDYEKTVESAQAVLQIAFISFLILRLAK
jgi:transposase